MGYVANAAIILGTAGALAGAYADSTTTVTTSTSVTTTAPAAAAAPASTAPKVTGSVELSYNYNLTNPTDSTGRANAFHSYDARSKTFLLNNARLDMTGGDSASGFGYEVTTDFGTDAGGGTGEAFFLEQALLTWTKGMWGIKAGKYVTYNGIEVVPGGANPTITRGFLYGLAEPTTHVGAEASVTSGPVDVHLGLVNGWDKPIDDNVMPLLMYKVGYSAGDPLALTVSGFFGPDEPNDNHDNRFTVDATALTKSIKMVDLWLQANYGMEAKASKVEAGKDAMWYGFGVQPLVHVNDKFSVGLRYELFSDPDGARTGATVKDFMVQNVTVAPAVALTKNVTARAEYRIDFASKDAFIDSDGKPSKNQQEVAADLVATF